MTPIDKDIIQRKLVAILRELSILDKISQVDSSSDITIQYTVQRALQNALTATIDAAQHIVIQETAEVPDSYADAISRLCALGVLEKEFTARFLQAAKFRNKLVHIYAEIDMDRVGNDLPKMKADLLYFLEVLRRKIE